MRARLMANCLLIAVAASGCGGRTDASMDTNDTTGAAGSGGDSSADGGHGGTGGANHPGDPAASTDAGDGAATKHHASKVDLLLMIDNSASMTDKQMVLAAALPDLVQRFTNPACVDADGGVVGTPPSSADPCPAGAARQFPPMTDMHIGVISSSLGGVGANSCSAADPFFNDTMVDMAHLVQRGQDAAYADKGFLQWGPGEDDARALGAAFANLVVGVGQEGCGFEQSLEAVYRFLIDPEPYEKITVTDTRAAFEGTDRTVLQQRADFLRPDSLVAIISLSDEDDCSVDPMVLDGQGWISLQRNTFLPRGTSACNADPNDECCVSCNLRAPSGCTQPMDDPQCQPNRKPTTDADQALNLRCFDQKRQFGVDFLYPIERYTCALHFDPSVCEPRGGPRPTTTWQAGKVPDRRGNLVDNPLFSDLRGTGKPPRDPSLVRWAMIVGVPWQDIARDPSNLEKGYMSPREIADSRRWDVILGEPEASPPVAPTDPLMVESIEPRSGKNPVTGDALVPPGGKGWNPMNGHEWTVDGRSDLQYACVFPLPTGYRDCAVDGASCDCNDARSENPLCAPFPGQVPETTQGIPQYGAKGYPGLRHLAVAKGLGAQAVVASICPSNMSDVDSADYGYRPAADALIEGIAPALK